MHVMQWYNIIPLRSARAFRLLLTASDESVAAPDDDDADPELVVRPLAADESVVAAPDRVDDGGGAVDDRDATDARPLAAPPSATLHASHTRPVSPLSFSLASLFEHSPQKE